MIKLLALPVGKDACSYYRVRKPIAGLNAFSTAVSGHVIDKDEDSAYLSQMFQHADVLLVRQGGYDGLPLLEQIPELNVRGKPWILDIDDNMEEVSPLSEFYRDFGLENFSQRTPNGQLVDLWKDGQDGFDIAHNRKKIDSWKCALTSASAVFVTTEHLADYARAFNEHVYVHPNSIDTAVWWEIRHQPHERLRVVWQGSPSHFEDWQEIAAPLNAVHKKYDFDLYLFGSAHQFLFDRKDRLHVYPWVPFDAHSYRMMATGADIAIIPLKDTAFNRNKSPIKWLEMGAMGVPSLVANVAPYSDVITPRNAVPYTSAKTFRRGLVSLLESATLRAKIGAQARADVVQSHTLRHATELFEHHIQEVYARSYSKTA